MASERSSITSKSTLNTRNGSHCHRSSSPACSTLSVSWPLRYTSKATRHSTTSAVLPGYSNSSNARAEWSASTANTIHGAELIFMSLKPWLRCLTKSPGTAVVFCESFFPSLFRFLTSSSVKLFQNKCVCVNTLICDVFLLFNKSNGCALF